MGMTGISELYTRRVEKEDTSRSFYLPKLLRFARVCSITT